MILRIGERKDLNFTQEMLFEAFFWNPIVERPNYKEFFKLPEINKLLVDWGRLGDRLIIAENEHEYIGAAWYRLWTKKDHSYGFVDPNNFARYLYESEGFKKVGESGTSWTYKLDIY